MPTVFREAGYRFFFYSNEGSPREPEHIHVSKDGKEAKFCVNPEVRLAYNDGYDARMLRVIAELVLANQTRNLEAWRDFFG